MAFEGLDNACEAVLDHLGVQPEEPIIFELTPRQQNLIASGWTLSLNGRWHHSSAAPDDTMSEYFAVRVQEIMERRACEYKIALSALQFEVYSD